MLTLRFTPTFPELVYDVDSLDVLKDAEASAREHGVAPRCALGIEIAFGALEDDIWTAVPAVAIDPEDGSAGQARAWRAIQTFADERRRSTLSLATIDGRPARAARGAASDPRGRS